MQVWHDMLINTREQDLIDFNAQDLLEPMLWSYAEDLKQNLQYSTWMALKPFKFALIFYIFFYIWF